MVNIKINWNANISEINAGLYVQHESNHRSKTHRCTGDVPMFILVAE